MNPEQLEAYNWGYQVGYRDGNQDTHDKYMEALKRLNPPDEEPVNNSKNLASPLTT